MGDALIILAYMQLWVNQNAATTLVGFHWTYFNVMLVATFNLLIDQEKAGKDLGILNIATTLGQTVGPIVTSILVVTGGYDMVFPTAIVFAIIACVFFQMIRSTK